MFWYVFLLHFIFLVVALIPIAESLTTDGAVANGAEHIEDESGVLTPEVVANVDAN